MGVSLRGGLTASINMDVDVDKRLCTHRAHDAHTLEEILCVPERVGDALPQHIQPLTQLRVRQWHVRLHRAREHGRLDQGGFWQSGSAEARKPDQSGPEN